MRDFENESSHLCGAEDVMLRMVTSQLFSFSAPAGDVSIHLSEIQGSNSQ